MKKIIIASALIFALPVMAVAGVIKEGAEKSTTVKAAPVVHHMQNNSGDATPAPEMAPAAVHSMSNSNPNPAASVEVQKPAEHSMKNN